VCLGGVCVGEHQPLGAACTPEAGEPPCVEGAYCSGDPGTCVAQGGIGAACSDLGGSASTCMSLLACLPSGGGVCTPPAGVGGACACPQVIGEGQPGRPARCSSSACRAFLACVTDADAGATPSGYAGHCEAELLLGQACDPALDLCGLGSCDPVARTCQLLLPDGAGCDPALGERCASGVCAPADGGGGTCLGHCHF
jgi:hypothetical protein